MASEHAHGPSDVPHKGDEMGRYVVLRQLGAGGMGMVYLGYDPELDRKVALKLLRGPSSGHNRRALQREAQAMAKLAHPNVVAVYDVGEHGGNVYVAMELVEGTTLQQWLRAAPRSWREVLEVFLSAGRGLAAAHAQELVHRDFKPHNVMIADDGHVRVMDFGLARPSHDSVDEDLDVQSLRSSLLTDATAGRFAGTPAYMAPEQVMGHDLDPAIDQFAFCVSLWEGICGERPFVGDTAAEALANAAEGRIRAPPSRARMPRWLRRALQRGLSPAARDRWPSMAALLAVLDRGRGRWRWQAGLTGLVLLGVGASVVVGQQRRRADVVREQIATCQQQGTTIDEVWNDRERTRLRNGLLATRARFANDSADKVVTHLDEYRDAWSTARTQACMHATVEHDWDEDLLDRAQWCFEDRRLQLEATVDQIATSNPAAARRAVRIASYLDPVSTCLDPTPLRNLPMPPAEQRAEIRSIRMLLSESDGLRYAGDFAPALEVAERATARAEALGWPPLLANTRLILGRSLLRVGRFDEAEAILMDAYFQAIAAGSIEVAFRAARSLTRILPFQLRYREAEIWARHAESLAPALDDPTGLDEAEEHYLLTEVHRGLGDYETAARHGEKAVEIRTRVLGVDHPITAAAHRELGRVYLSQGRFREALALLERSHDVWLDAVGPEHPYVGDLLRLRGHAQLQLGRVDEALDLQSKGFAILEPGLGEDHPKTALALDELGQGQRAVGRIEDAERSHLRAMELRRMALRPHDPTIAQGLLDLAAVDVLRGLHDRALQRCAEALDLLETAHEPGHPDIAGAMERTADVLLAMGRIEEAVERRHRALARRERARGAHDRQLLTPLVQLGDALRAASRLEQARAAYQRALDIGEPIVGPDGDDLVPSLAGLAEVALARGDRAAALRFAERAVGIAGRIDVGPRRSAMAHFVLARALDGDDEASRTRARTLAGQARRELEVTHDPAGVAEVDRWLASVDEQPWTRPSARSSTSGTVTP